MIIGMAALVPNTEGQKKAYRGIVKALTEACRYSDLLNLSDAACGSAVVIEGRSLSEYLTTLAFQLGKYCK